MVTSTRASSSSPRVSHRRVLLVLLVAAVMIVSWGCQSVEVVPQAPAAVTASPAADASAGRTRVEPTPTPVAPLPGGTAQGTDAVPRTVVKDDGPLLTRLTGTVEVETRPRYEQAATGHLRAADGHVYVIADYAGLSNYSVRVLDIVLDDDRPGVAVLSHGQLAVRLPDDAALDAGIALTVFAHDDHYAGHGDARGVVQPLRITGVMDSPAIDDLDATFYRTAAGWYDHHDDAFSRFAAQRLEWRATDGLDALDKAARDARRVADLGSTMDLYTGMTSVHEALQTDRGLGLRSEPASARTIPIEDVEPTEVAGHPWAEMIEELGREPVVETLAAVVPDDVLYLHFGDLRDFVVTADEIDQWLTPVGQAWEGRGGSTHFTDRYQAQLAVERSALSKTLGHLAAGSVALVAGDPYLREGTDVSLVFEVANASLLDTTLQTYADAARERHPDLTERTYELDGHTVTVLETPDREVYRHRVALDGGKILILSNSPGAIARFVDVEQGRHRALADAGDFRYLRAVYPSDAAEESGFVFIGDELVRRVIGPAHKIQQARRMAAHADLMAVNHTAMLASLMEGALPATGDELVATGWMDAAELAHVDGEPIGFDVWVGANSERWGRAVALTPLVDAGAVTHVSPAEADAYRAFADEYQEYWRTFVDPIGVRLTRSHDGRTLSVDARMLPLIEATEYDELIEVVGDLPLGSVEASGAGGLRWAVALGPDTRLRRELESMGEPWLGQWAMIGVDAHSAVWDLAVMEREVPGLFQPSPSQADELAVFDRVPLWVAVDVSNMKAARTLFDGLIVWLDGAHGGGSKSTYRDVEVVTTTFMSGAIDTHWAFFDDMIVASVRLDTLQARIDEALDGRLRPKPATADEVDQVHLRIEPGPADGWMTRTLLGMLEKEQTHGHRDAERAETLLRRVAGHDLDAESHRRLGLALLGFEPHSPSDAPSATVTRFTRDAHGLLTHPVYGSALAPRVPELPVEDSVLTRAVDAFHSVEARVGFEGEGNHRGLHVKLEWTRR